MNKKDVIRFLGSILHTIILPIVEKMKTMMHLIIGYIDKLPNTSIKNHIK